MMLNRIHWMLRHACITKPKQSKSTIMSLIDSIEFLVWCFCNGLVKWTQKMAYLLLVEFGNWQSFFRPDLSTSTKMMLSYADMQDIVEVSIWDPRTHLTHQQFPKTACEMPVVLSGTWGMPQEIPCDALFMEYLDDGTCWDVGRVYHWVIAIWWAGS